MALRSILAKKGRTALTMLGVIIGVAPVIILVSVVQGSNRRVMEYYERLGAIRSPSMSSHRRICGKSCIIFTPDTRSGFPA
ncbi:ABC transporter permease [uncultured Oscillibacter sp.]|uniref:ABC transporter permease n=2 Tax=uncultured Oscillibacter sp. TaxID=876091 RepID=UPI0034550B52